MAAGTVTAPDVEIIPAREIIGVTTARLTRPAAVTCATRHRRAVDIARSTVTHPTSPA